MAKISRRTLRRVKPYLQRVSGGTLPKSGYDTSKHLVARPGSRSVKFNRKNVAKALYKKNPAKFQKKVVSNLGGKRTVTTVRDTQKLKEHVSKLRKKTQTNKARQLKQKAKLHAAKNKPIKAELVKPAKAASSLGGQSSTGSHLKVLGAAATVNSALRKRVLSAVHSLRKAGSFRV